MSGEPLFDNAHSALLFAFHFNHQTSALSPMAKLMMGPVGGGKGLGGLDGAAQAGMIRAEVMTLCEYDRNLIIARFAIEPKENLEAKAALVNNAIALCGTGIHHRRLVDALVQRYFGRKDVMLCEWASRLDVHPSTITRKWHSVRNGFRKAEVMAQERIEMKLLSKGIVGC